jgi:hypothetical protein
MIRLTKSKILVARKSCSASFGIARLENEASSLFLISSQSLRSLQAPIVTFEEERRRKLRI